MTVPELQSPSEQPLVSPSSESTRTTGFPNGTADAHNGGPAGGAADTKVQMKKQLGLLEGVAIILGIIFGSGE